MPTRRDFLKGLGATAAVAATAGAASVSAGGHGGHHGPEIYEESYGVLTDLTKCVGCRQCEWACNEENKLRPSESIDSLEDQSVFDEFRRPDEVRYTVVNRYKGKGLGGGDMFAKVQCMHCDYPPCASACLVGALKKDPWGPVTYDAWKCIGCRYCIQACPWAVPAYEYNNRITPRVMKCTMCFSRTTTEHDPKPDIRIGNFLTPGRGLPPQEKGKPTGKAPACVTACPQEAMIFGKRSELLEIAHERINKHPDRYIDHVLGEHEVGGTAWMYISNQPFEDVGFPKNMPNESPAALLESIQHGIFKKFASPVMLFGACAGLMHVNGFFKHGEKHDTEGGSDHE